MSSPRRSRVACFVSLAFAAACGGTAVDHSRAGSTTGSTGGTDGVDAAARVIVSAPTKCVFTSDCASGLVCLFGECRGSADPSVPPSSPSMKCKLNSECNSGLVCAFGLCHSECEGSRDCPAGQRCVVRDADAGQAPVCQLIAEARCFHATDCEIPLVCAADFQCRNECIADRDCATGQRCSYGACAEPSELDPSGYLKGRMDGGIQMGLPGGGGTP